MIVGLTLAMSTSRVASVAAPGSSSLAVILMVEEFGPSGNRHTKLLSTAGDSACCVPLSPHDSVTVMVSAPGSLTL